MPNITKEVGVQPFRRVAVVERFFDIIYNVHVGLGGRSGRHAGQKRTYRMVSRFVKYPINFIYIRRYSILFTFIDNRNLRISTARCRHKISGGLSSMQQNRKSPVYPFSLRRHMHREFFRVGRPSHHYITQANTKHRQLNAKH